jgi:hypothetical protein
MTQADVPAIVYVRLFLSHTQSFKKSLTAPLPTQKMPRFAQKLASGKQLAWGIRVVCQVAIIDSAAG